MLIARAFSDVLAVLGVLGLGGVIGAIASHFLTKRRERAAHERARTDRREDEDREQILVLGAAIQGLRSRFGGFPSQTVDDGTKTEWGDEERERAHEYVAALDEFTVTLQTVKRHAYDAYLRSELGWTAQLIGLACEALREARPSPSAFLVHQALSILEQDIDAFLHNGRPAANDLQWAFYDELAESLRQGGLDSTTAGLMSRIQIRLAERQARPDL